MVLGIIGVIQHAHVSAVCHLHDARRHEVVEEERDGTAGDRFVPAMASSSEMHRTDIRSCATYVWESGR